MQFTPRQIFLMAFISVALQGATSISWGTIPIPKDYQWTLTLGASLISYFQGLVLWVISSQGVKFPGVAAETTVGTAAAKVASVVALMIGIGLMMALLIAPASAQLKRPAAPLAPSSIGSVLDSLAAKGTADLQAADALAAATDPDTNQVNDPIAHACYPALIRFVASLPKPPADGVMPGPALLFERARITRRLVQSGLPDYLKIGCAPLVQDEAGFVTKLLAIAGVTVASGGLALPGIPGLLPALSIP